MFELIVIKLVGFHVFFFNLNFQKSARNPLFLPYMSGSSGFTAVILSYNRVDSLFKIINMIGKAPSLQKIIVVWNYQYKSPPHCKYFYGKKYDWELLLADHKKYFSFDIKF